MLGVSIVLFVVLLAVLFAVAAVTAGFGDLMKPVFQDARPVGMPDGAVRPADLDDLRFNVVLRGYKMAEVDAVLHRMARELAERDAVLAELRGEGPFRRGLPVPPPDPPYDPPATYVAPGLSPLDAPTELLEPVMHEPAVEPVVAPVVDDTVTEQFLIGDETQGFPVYEAPPLEPETDHG